MSKINELKDKVWAICDTLRKGGMECTKYKDVIMPLYAYAAISYKFLYEVSSVAFCEETFDIESVVERYKNEYDDNFGEDSPNAIVANFSYYVIRPKDLFSELVKRAKAGTLSTADVVDSFNSYLDTVERIRSFIEVDENTYNLVFSVVNPKYITSEISSNDIRSIIVQIDSLFNMSISDIFECITENNEEDFRSDLSDVFGNIYEILLSYFATNSAKNAGEFFTPQSASLLIAKIANCGRKVGTVYDPTCGSGSLLLRTVEYSKANNLSIDGIYGQELNSGTVELCKQNMLIRLNSDNYSNVRIEQGNTLSGDKFKDKNDLILFDTVVANPPFSIKNWNLDVPDTDVRFLNYGGYTISSKADFAFVQHSLAHLKDNGVACFVLPLGVLYRGSKEKKIRQFLMDNLNCIDTVIELAPNMFYGATIPVCIIVFKKNRKSDDVLFINASEIYEHNSKKNFMSEENIDTIFDMYANRKNVEGLSSVVPIDLVRKNDYCLSVGVYVEKQQDLKDTVMDEDIEQLEKELSALMEREAILREKIKKFQI